MSGQMATIELAAEPSIQTGTQTDTPASPGAAAEPGPPPGPAAETAAQPEVTIQDVLVEDVSIDGMCGVY